MRRHYDYVGVDFLLGVQDGASGLARVDQEFVLEPCEPLVGYKEIGALPVVNYGRLIGIITSSNLWFPEQRPLPEWVSRT
jgi:CBS domain-containing protein